MVSMTATFVSIALAATAALLPATTEAHQRVTIPAPTFTAGKDIYNNPVAFLENQGFTANGDFNAYRRGKGYKTLRAFMDSKSAYKPDQAGATFECGYTDPNGTRQPIPANKMIRSTGFTHDGPCEVWIDNVRVKAGDNCHTDIGTGMISYEVDWSSCKGDCMLRWYWLGIRKIGSKWSWQVYKECIPIRAGAAREADEEEGEVGAEAEPRGASNATAAATKCGVKK